jgi:RNase P/RNase MRP subunit p30
MRRFADLHLKPSIENDENKHRMAELASQLGFSLVALTFKPETPDEEMRKVKSIFNDAGLDAAARVDLAPGSRNELLRALRRLRRKFEIVAVECKTMPVALIAARDTRVDIVYFEPEETKARFQESTAHLCNATLEINLSGIIKPKISPRSNIIAKLSDYLATAKNHAIPIIISSGADNPHMLRAPRDMAALATSLGLRIDEALDSLSKIPISILEKNRIKLSPSYVAEGVKIVRMPKNA